MTLRKDAPVLHVDWIALPQAGWIGMTHCPGRRGLDSEGHDWRRDLRADLDRLIGLGTTTLVTLIEEHEFETLGVPDLPRLAASGLVWIHIPVANMAAPDPRSLRAWRSARDPLLNRLRADERVVFHCAAGLGRTGAFVAKLLVDVYGVQGSEALRRVRAARPGTIESAPQEAFVRGPHLL
ncbi:MAG: hypothetical protein ACO3Z6_14015 [Pseudomonadales bacterium]